MRWPEKITLLGQARTILVHFLFAGFVMGKKNASSEEAFQLLLASPGNAGRGLSCAVLQRVVHIKLDRVGGHAQAGDLFHLQIDVGIYHVVGEHAASGQEGAVGIQGVQGLVQ